MASPQESFKSNPYIPFIKPLEQLQPSNFALTGISHTELAELAQTGSIEITPLRKYLLSGFNLVVPRGNTDENIQFVAESAHWTSGLFAFYHSLEADKLAQIPSLQDTFYRSVGDLYTGAFNDLNITQYDGLYKLAEGMKIISGRSLDKNIELIQQYLLASIEYYHNKIGAVLVIDKGKIKYTTDYLNHRDEGFLDRPIDAKRIKGVFVENEDILNFSKTV